MKKNSIRNHPVYMTTIDDTVFLFCSYFKTVNTVNNKVDNCAYVSIAIFTLNLSVLFCLRMKKSLNIKKSIAIQMFLRLHSERSTKFFVRDGKFPLRGNK